MAGGLDEHRTLVAWEHINFNSGASAIATPYDVPHVLTEFRNCEAPLRSGSYRALASTANAFARESFMDELAAAANVDPLQFRLQHLSHSRLRAVLESAAASFGWDRSWKRNATRQSAGIGLACGTEKDSFVATCAEIRMDADGPQPSFRVTRVCTAFECGAIQNPANLKAQVEGCLIQGLGGALTESIQFENGRILNPRFSRYRVPRFRDVPQLDIVLVNRPDLPSVGAGETPIIGIAPAVANALFHAVQTRVRSLPLNQATLQAAR
jgi:isoquinoline 1-oxidoreductase